MLPRIHLLKLECMQKVSVGLATVKVSFSGMHLFPDLETSREIACRRLIGKSTCGALLLWVKAGSSVLAQLTGSKQLYHPTPPQSTVCSFGDLLGSLPKKKKLFVTLNSTSLSQHPAKEAFHHFRPY